MALPERKSNEHNAMRVLGARLHLDSPRNQHGVMVKAKQTDGWLHIEVDADDSIKGWALSYNGRDVPIYVDQFGNENLSDEQVDQIMSRDEDQPESS